MRMLRKLMLGGAVIAAMSTPTLAQQDQQQMPMMGHGTMMGGQSGTMGGQQGMMGGQQGMMGGQQGMMGGQQGMMGSGMGTGGCPMMGGMMGSGMQGTMGQGMMGHGMMQGGMGPGMMQGGMAAMFGSRVTPMMNLSAEDVRGYLTAQVDRLNNKRLKVGDVKADDGSITADIVTVDNSLVQRLKVDRHTGSIEYQN